MYLIPAIFVVFIVWRISKFKKVKALLPQMIAEGAIVVDVRSVAEFRAGSSPGSINIPLNILAAKALELDKSKPVILCCASGARSGAAVGILKSMGFQNVVNAGPWTNTLS